MYKLTIELVSFRIGIKFVYVYEKFDVWTGPKPESPLSPMNDKG